MSALIPLVGLGLNAGLLARRAVIAKARVLPGFRVLATIEDDTERFTVPVLGFPFATITAVSPTDPQTPGTSISVSISVHNSGVAGTCWCYVDGDRDLARKEASIRHGGTYNFVWPGAFTMPYEDVHLTAHAGHIE